MDDSGRRLLMAGQMSVLLPLYSTVLALRIQSSGIKGFKADTKSNTGLISWYSLYKGCVLVYPTTTFWFNSTPIHVFGPGGRSSSREIYDQILDLSQFYPLSLNHRNYSLVSRGESKSQGTCTQHQSFIGPQCPRHYDCVCFIIFCFVTPLTASTVLQLLCHPRKSIFPILLRCSPLPSTPL